MIFTEANIKDIPRFREDMKRWPPGTPAIEAVALNFGETELAMLPMLRAVSCDVIMRTITIEKALEIAVIALDSGVDEFIELAGKIEGAIEYIEAEDAGLV
jgi:hypothetical protein